MITGIIIVIIIIIIYATNVPFFIYPFLKIYLVQKVQKDIVRKCFVLFTAAVPRSDRFMH
jgi:hypothetical protein